MANRDGLPAGVQWELDALGRRIRLLRAAHGLCRIVLIQAIAAFVAVAAYTCFVFATWVRMILLTAWVGIGLLELRRVLVRAFSEPLPAVALAGAVEGEFPRLDERLTTTTELSNGFQPANGAPGLFEEVVRETEIRTGRVDFRAAAPAR